MAHPDAGTIRRMRDALVWWESTTGGPTSSVTGGGAICCLESSFAELVDGRPCIAVPSGTAALQVALHAVGVRRDDEVVCTGYDWAAAACAVRSLGAAPVFAAVDPRTLTIDPDDAASRITPQTGAIVVTHLFGVPADVTAVRRHADPQGLPVVEDAAQALGARLDGRPVGTLGAAAAFSLGPGKVVDAGEGGVVVLRDRPLYEAALRASQHPARQLLAGLDEVAETPLSARMPAVVAILAAHALRALPGRLAEHRRHFDAVRWLACSCGLEVLGADERRQPNHWRVPVRVAVPGACGTITLACPGAAWRGDDAAPGHLASVRTAHLPAMATR